MLKKQGYARNFANTLLGFILREVILFSNESSGSDFIVDLAVFYFFPSFSPVFWR
ncbi:MAG: hypothetical protein ACI8WB_000560 [Phenylobacterium sp.]|jgi:hypothetical protein